MSQTQSEEQSQALSQKSGGTQTQSQKSTQPVQSQSPLDQTFLSQESAKAAKEDPDYEPCESEGSYPSDGSTPLESVESSQNSDHGSQQAELTRTPLGSQSESQSQADVVTQSQRQASQ